MSKTHKLIQLQQEQALRAATVQVEKILYNSPPLTLAEIQAQSWFRRRLLRQALEQHPYITAHGPRDRHRTYEIELHRGHPLPQLDGRLNMAKSHDSKATPGKRKKKGK